MDQLWLDSVKMQYASSKGSDNITGLEVCDDFRDWLGRYIIEKITSDNSDYAKCQDSPSGEHSYQDQPVCVHCGHFA